jgi:hypothetical protein
VVVACASPAPTFDNFFGDAAVSCAGGSRATVLLLALRICAKSIRSLVAAALRTRRDILVYFSNLQAVSVFASL